MGITVYGFLISKKGWIKQMDFFDLLTMIGGLSLFLFGMNLMGQALETTSKNIKKVSTSRDPCNRREAPTTAVVPIPNFKISCAQVM